jgi:hypothetical protein
LSYQEAFAKLIEAKEEFASIWTFFEAEHPHEAGRLHELEKEIPVLQDQAKDALRAHGKSGEYLSYSFRVQTSKRTEVDAEGLIERAKERGEVESLLEKKFLVYSVEPKQLERLPGPLQAIYGRFIETKPGTASIFLPPELK